MQLINVLYYKGVIVIQLSTTQNPSYRKARNFRGALIFTDFVG